MGTLTSFIGVEHPTYLVHAKATHHRSNIEVYVPLQAYSKMEPGWEARHNEESDNRTLRGRSMNLEENAQRALRRARREVRILAANNDFKWWATFTIAEDRQDTRKTFLKLNTWLKSEKRKVGKFDYLIVPEQHKDAAIHFHALIGNNYKGELVEAINVKTGKPHKPFGRQVYHFKTYKYGFNKVERIESQERIATYLTKYITKDMHATDFNKKHYWASRGLARPRTEDNPAWLKDAMGKQISNVALEQGMLFYFPTSVAPPLTPSK